MTAPLLLATDLKVSYGNKAAVIDGLNFSLSQGEYLGLSGPSGSGKTTLLRLCAGLYGLDHNPNVEGRLMYGEDLNLVEASPKSLLGFRRDVVSMITEIPRAGLHPQRTVANSWKYYQMNSDLNSSLERLGIIDIDRIAKAYPHELSGGEAQRIRLAFALEKKPSLLLLESPTAALDRLNAELVWTQVESAKKSGAAILHVDHNLALLSINADRMLRLGDDIPTVEAYKYGSNELGDVVLSAADVNVSYGDFTAVQNVNLELRAGEFVALQGPSGIGKSSLGKALARIIPATGSLNIQGVNSSAFAKTPYAQAGTTVQYIWQEPRLSMNPRFTVAKTLSEVTGGGSYSPERLLELVDLGLDKLHQSTLLLSTGEQQRLAIARALAVGPKVLICDEITSGLDNHRARHILNTLQHLRKELGIAILFITHDESLAENEANRIIRLS